MVLGICANVLKPWPLAFIIDHLLGNKPLPHWVPTSFASLGKPASIAVCAFLVFGLHVASGVFSAGQTYVSIKSGLRGLARIRNQLFDWMQRMSLAFYQRSNTGDLIYRATWDTYSLQTLFQQGLFKFINATLTLVLMLVILWNLNHSLAGATLAVFPPLIAAMYFFSKRMNAKSLAAHKADSAVSSRVQQNITSLPVVQSYVQEKNEQAQFERTVESSFEKRRSQHLLEVIYWFVIALLFAIATAFLTWLGAMDILKNQLTIGELVIFLSYLGQLYEPLNQLTLVGTTVSDANAGMARIFEILDTEEQVPERANAKPFPAGKSLGISFDHVSFSYRPSTKTLTSVSFKVEPGTVLGIVGPSGSGKTTLLNLIPRFYDPSDGCITIDGVDTRDFRLCDLRRSVAYVFQESLLIPGTVAENISYGNPAASMKDIEEAANLASAHEFISKLQNGYQTMIGEGTARLSVGEKQRLGIARAFLKNAPILLLDEPTSSLDIETESEIIRSMANLMRGRTCIVAAHRLASLARADKLITLEHGRISECGTPDELLKSGNYFSRIVQSHPQNLPSIFNFKSE